MSTTLNLIIQLTLPDGEIQPRFSHSTTAITLAPGLIEVIIFGGCPEWRKNAKTDDDWSKLAGTTILRFGKCHNNHWYLYVQFTLHFMCMCVCVCV